MFVIPVPKIPLKSGKGFLEISAVFITSWGDTSLDKSFLYSHFLHYVGWIHQIKNIKSSLLYHLRQSSFWKFYFSWWPFAKALQSFETCVSVQNSLNTKLLPSIQNSPLKLMKDSKIFQFHFLFQISFY